MKASILFLIVCAFAFSAYAADEPEYSKNRVEALIASLPTPIEMARFSSSSDGRLNPKMIDTNKRFGELLSQIKPGRSIFDYPGILTLGTLKWDAKKRTYTLRVEASKIGGDEGSFAGFTCIFSDAGIIIEKKMSVWVS